MNNIFTHQWRNNNCLLKCNYNSNNQNQQKNINQKPIY